MRPVSYVAVVKQSAFSNSHLKPLFFVGFKVFFLFQPIEAWFRSGFNMHVYKDLMRNWPASGRSANGKLKGWTAYGNSARIYKIYNYVSV